MEGETDPAVLGVRARILNNLSVRLSDLGRREEALAAIEEAVAVYRELAALRPDAFRPDLARSLAVLGNCLEAMGSLDQAIARDREAVAMLLPYLQRWPDSYAGLMRAICTGYLRRCEAAGVEPDAELLAPVVDAFQRLRGVDTEAFEEDGRRA